MRMLGQTPSENDLLEMIEEVDADGEWVCDVTLSVCVCDVTLSVCVCATSRVIRWRRRIARGKQTVVDAVAS